jgi:peroxiredoxin Q/BCP
VRPDRLAELMEVSERTVQRARALARDLGLYVIVTPGRMLTVDECVQARQEGSRQRGFSNPPGERRIARVRMAITEPRECAVSVRLSPGDPAPDFTLLDADGNKVALADLRGQRVILYVYPAAMTPGCTKQACDFRDNIARVHGAGYTVLGLSPDSPAKLAKFRERDAIPFPLLSDPDKGVLAAYGAYGAKMMYGKTVQGVIRSTFVIDARGNIETAQYGVKATGHVDRLLAQLSI